MLSEFIQVNLGMPERRLEYNIIMYLKEISVNMRNWSDSTQDRDYWSGLLNAILHLRIQYHRSSGK